MRVGLSGTKWTGKSTTIAALGATTTVDVVSLSPIVARCPWPVEVHQTLEASEWVLDRLQELLASPHREGLQQVFDRTPLDVLTFSVHAHRIASPPSVDRFAAVEQRALSFLRHFDRIFLTGRHQHWPSPKTPTEESRRFSIYIEELMDELIRTYRIEVVRLPNEIPERVRLLQNYLQGTL